MRLDDLRSTGNVDDRRGSGGGFAVGGLGLVGVVIVALLLGVDPSQLLGDSGLGQAPAQAPASSQPGAPRADDAAYAFARSTQRSVFGAG